MELKVGMWVRRKKIDQSPHWIESCRLVGINPEAAIKIDEVRGGEPVFLPISPGAWWATCFEQAVPPNKSLEDYL